MNVYKDSKVFQRNSVRISLGFSMVANGCFRLSVRFTSSHQLRFINIFTGLYVEEEALDGEGAASAGELVSKPLFLREDDGLD